jgi:hypothetical protein
MGNEYKAASTESEEKRKPRSDERTMVQQIIKKQNM